MNSIGRICIYVYISSKTCIYSISPKGFIQAGVSVTLLQGGKSSQKKKNIYIHATPGGEEKKIFFAYPPPSTPCETKMRRMWPLGTRSMPMPSSKKMEHMGTSTGDTWGRSKDTKG
jgi:hypothetical protein